MKTSYNTPVSANESDAIMNTLPGALNFTLPALNKALREKGRMMTFPKNVIFELSGDEVYIVQSGLVEATPDMTGSPSLGHVFTHMPLGLIEKHGRGLAITYKVDETARILALRYSDFINIISTFPSGAQYMCQLFGFISSALMYIHYERNISNGFATIRHLVYRYYYKYAGQKSGTETLSGFILKRTSLSRSYVFQLLSELKDLSYIHTVNGKRLTIHRPIPEQHSALC